MSAAAPAARRAHRGDCADARERACHGGPSNSRSRATHRSASRSADRRRNSVTAPTRWLSDPTSAGSRHGIRMIGSPSCLHSGERVASAACRVECPRRPRMTVELIEGTLDTASVSRIVSEVLRWTTFDPDVIEHLRATTPTWRDWIGLLDGEPVGVGGCGVGAGMEKSSAVSTPNISPARAPSRSHSQGRPATAGLPTRCGSLPAP